MHDETTVSIQHAAQVIERARQVDTRNIDTPVLVRLQRLREAGPLARGLNCRKQAITLIENSRQDG
jgi:hypothetical protein